MACDVAGHDLSFERVPLVRLSTDTSPSFGVDFPVAVNGLFRPHSVRTRQVFAGAQQRS